MKKISHYIWVLRFLCIFSLLLALLFTRYIDKIGRENKLAALAAEKSAFSTASSVFAWQNDKAEYLYKLVTALQAANVEDWQQIISQQGAFSALFVTDADGVVTNIFPEHHAKQMSGFLKIRKEQDTQPSLLYLEEVFSAPALAIPYERDGSLYMLYAVMDKADLAMLTYAQHGEYLTLFDSNENVIVSAKPGFKAGMIFTELNQEYIALGGGFYQKGGNEPALARRVNTRGFFGWSVFSEVPLNVWLYGYYPVYFILVWAAVIFVFSLYLSRFKDKYLKDIETDNDAKEKAEKLKARMLSIVEKDRE